MPLSEKELEELIDKRITERFQNIGVWDHPIERLEATRANNKLVNEIRLARDQRQGLLRRSFSDIMSSISGNLIWVALTAVAVYLLQFIPGHKP